MRGVGSRVETTSWRRALDGFDARDTESGRAHEAASGSVARPLLRDPVVGILALAGIFDGISGNPVHSVLLFSAALALAWDDLRPTPLAPPLLPDRVAAGRQIVLVGLATALAYSAFVGGFPRYSWEATVAVMVPSALALALAWRGPLIARAIPSGLSPVGTVSWLAVFVALALWELVQLLLQPTLTLGSYAHPTISVLTDPALAAHPGRSIALAVWLLLGGWFLTR